MTRPRRPMPPPLKPPAPGLWRRTPPAIFPPIFGLFGLGLGWRAAGQAFGISPGFGDMILGAVAILFLFALVAWLAKPLRRPAVVLEELRVLPGRAGVAAASLCLMLLAASLVPFAPVLALGLALLANLAQAAFIILLTYVMRTGPAEGRVVTPIFHLSFVGFILGGLVANALGHHEVAKWLLWAMLVPAGLIWGISARQLLARVPPAPLRPLLAIHLAPAALFAIVAQGAGLEGAAYAFMALAAAIFAALLVALRWLTASGFSPLWGAFTFPLAAFATALITVSQGVGPMAWAGGVLLAGATITIPLVAFRILKMWASGPLAAKTNAAEA